MPTTDARNVADKNISGVVASAFNYYDGYVPTNAIDGTWTEPSRWVGADWNAGQYFKVDLGQSRSIDQWRVYQTRNSAGNDGLGLAGDGHPATYAPNLKLQSSPDNSTWTDRHTLTGLTAQDTGYLTIPSGPFSARYWRILITGGGPGNSPEFYEVELLATGLNPTVRLSQEPVEVVIEPSSGKVRLSQEPVEVVIQPSSQRVRLSQEVVEAVILPTSGQVRVSQFVVEVLTVLPKGARSYAKWWG